jgi:hypothetical protein
MFASYKIWRNNANNMEAEIILLHLSLVLMKKRVGFKTRVNRTPSCGHVCLHFLNKQNNINNNKKDAHSICFHYFLLLMLVWLFYPFDHCYYFVTMKKKGKTDTMIQCNNIKRKTHKTKQTNKQIHHQ